MKVLIYSDPHWSTYSSILRQRGRRYSIRLENLIKSINWTQEFALKEHVDEVWCLGDFFDKNNLNAEELDALKEIKWANVTQRFLVGNHEIVSTSDSYSSTQLFTSIGFQVIGEITSMKVGNTELLWLPYMTEDNRVPIDKIELDKTCSKRIILSHNDLKMQYGMFASPLGYDPNEVSKYCDLFLNGHLHNMGTVNDKVINVGNLTGQNFSEDGEKYKHCAFILDTDTCYLKSYENPYEVLFYKFELRSEEDLELFKFGDFPNSVASISVEERLYEKAKPIIDSKEFLSYRVIIVANNMEVDVIESDSLKLERVDHLAKLREFCLEKIGNFDIVKEELEEVCK